MRRLILHLFLQMIIAVQYSAATYCSDGWLDLDENCIKMLIPEEGSWFDIQHKCDEEGGFLPELISSEQKDLFQLAVTSYWELFGQYNIFLGGNDLVFETDWRWRHYNLPIDESSWQSGCPDASPNNEKDCMLLNLDGLWEDVNCDSSETVGILCMRENIESTTQETINPCESGWTFFQNETDSCYLWMNNRTTWEDAKSICQNMISPYSHLVSIQNEYESLFVSQLAGGYAVRTNFWTGGYRNPDGEAPWNATGTWKWEDDTNWEFSNWFSGQPNDENGLYVFSNCYGSHGKWCDKEGEDQLTFICEYEL